MTGRRIVYFLLLLAAVGLCALCGSIPAAAAALLLLLTPLVCVPLHLMAARHLRVQLRLPVNLEKNAPGTLGVEFEKSGFLPLCLIGCSLSVENRLTGGRQKLFVRAFAPTGRKHTAEYDLVSAHCGSLLVQTQRVRLYDPFGLIGIPWRDTAEAKTAVQPKTFTQAVLVGQDAWCPDDNETYSQEKPGFDLSEVYQLRDYQPGDSLRQMHWKLSEKLDRLVIREPSLPVQRSILVLWERAQTESETQSDVQADVIVTLCRSLLEAGAQFTLAWNDTAEGRLVMQPLHDLDELSGILPRLLAARAGAEDESAAERFCRSEHAAAFSHIVYLTGAQPERGAGLERFGSLTTLCEAGGAAQSGAVTFDMEHYPEQLMELTV